MTLPRPGSGPAAGQAAGRRIEFGPARVVIRDFPLLTPGAEPELRAFLERAFSLREVHAVEFDRQRGLGRISHAVTADPGGLWRRLGRALRGDTGPTPLPDRAGGLFLVAPGPLRITRVGDALTTLRVRHDGPDHVRIGHPLLGRLPHMRWRLEEEIAALPGVRAFRAHALTAEVSIRLEPGPRATERLVRALEASWPRLLAGPEGPPARRRLAVATGLFAIAATGQAAVPALLPVAVAGIVLQGAPNIVAALRELWRGRIGLSALHATGLVFFLFTRQPLPSTLLGVLTHLLPALAEDRAIASQRRLLAPWRRRPRWAWLLLDDGREIEVPVDRLAPGDRILLRRGETVPADGTLEHGLVAALGPLTPAGDPADKEPGDALHAGERILDGEAVLRLTAPAGDAVAARIEARLPHGLFTRLPALDEAERAANRNARPALALSVWTLAARGQLRPAQGVLRPDYVTAPRIGAQLAAQAAFAEALQAGVLLHHPAALHALSRAQVFILDDTAPLSGRALEIGRIVTTGMRDTEVLALAAPVFGTAPAPSAIRRRAGAAWYEDAAGDRIEVASAAALAASGLAPADPGGPRSGVRRRLWVLRNGSPLGRIDFRTGPARAARASLDRLRNGPGPEIRIFLLSRGDKAAAARLGAELGTEVALGGLTPEDKAQVIRSLGQRTVWIGDGTAPGSAASIAASTVSLSTAAPAPPGADRADALLLAGLDGVAAARAVARAERAALAADARLLYGTNLSAVVGALAAGFGGFDSGLLSHAGAAAILIRHARRLRTLEATQKGRERNALAAFLT